MKEITTWFAAFAFLLSGGCDKESSNPDNFPPPPANEATLSTDELEIVVGDIDLEKTITVTLSEEALSDAVFAVAIESDEGGVEAVDKTITIPEGEKTGTGVIRFLKKAYPIELMTGTAIVSVSTQTPGFSAAAAGNLVFNIKGTGTAPVAYFHEADEPVKVKVSPNGTLYNFIIGLSEPLDKEAVFHVAAECDKDGGYKDLSDTIIIPIGSTRGFGTIFFPGNKYPYDTDTAIVTLKISSDDVIVLYSGWTLQFEVSGEIVNPYK